MVSTFSENKSLETNPALDSLLRVLEEPEARPLVEGMGGASRAWFWVQYWKSHRRPVVFVVPDLVEAETLLGDLRFFIRRERLRLSPEIFPGWELLPYEPLSPLSETSGDRLDLLDRLLNESCTFLIVTVETAIQMVMPRQLLQDRTYHVKRGDSVERELLEICLIDNGYTHESLVQERGQFSLRGDILDIFLPSHSYPVRLEFFGDEVESIRHFDFTSQISVEEIDQVSILPVREICLSGEILKQGMDRIQEYTTKQNLDTGKLEEVLEALKETKSFSGIEWLSPFFFNTRETLLDYISESTLVVLDEPDRIQNKIDEFYGLVLEEFDRSIHRGDIVPLPDDLFLSPGDWESKIHSRLKVEHQILRVGQEEDSNLIRTDYKTLPTLYGHFDTFCETATQWREQGWNVAVAAPTKGHVQRINELLLDRHLEIEVVQGFISAGFMDPLARQVFVAEHEIFGRSHKHRNRRRQKSFRFQRGFQDLKPGDLLVHVDYGIGKYSRTKEITTGIGSGEFMEILFAEDQKLYIPMDGLGVIQKYVGSGDSHPPLSKLGGVSWKRQKKKIQESILKMAAELVKIYASRQMAESPVCQPDPVTMQEFSDSFEYVETEDQLKAIEDTLNDLETGKPMDRLICGDVGYGKTEVAMRAAFKMVLEKRQVAVLVPTTILAQQHLNTFRERFRNWPVTIEMVSRFRTPAQQKETLKRLKEGKVDILIGTHRILSKDVQFPSLGLLVVDEEQRFGVKHKEQLKKLRSSVDILTLTATPIPRTLHFSLMGVRDLSVIETPPCDRLAVKTYIRKFDEEVIRDAIVRELDRNGQIYFVHNQVQGIHSIAALIQKIVPHVRVGVAHGQMQEAMLERTMKQFLDHEIDLLLCTSIIESGLDIPNANTIIINRADRFGLAQLYQLRGRVGRYKHQAYSYLLFPGTGAITPEARKRLFAIEEMSELGAGFQLATRDLEIRGTGNMLGKNQSGHISAIGFDLYCQMMDDTIREMKGQKVESRMDAEIDIQIKGFIPKDYVPELNQRLELYRRLQVLTNTEDLGDLKKEMIDRFGKMPESLEKLMILMQIKLLSQKLHITRVRLNRQQVTMDIDKTTPMQPEGMVRVVDPRLKFVSEFQMVLEVEPAGWKDVADMILDYLERLEETLPEDENVS